MKEHYSQLLKKYMQHDLSREEEQELMNWVNASSAEDVMAEMEGIWREFDAEKAFFSTAESTDMLQKMLHPAYREPVVYRIPFMRRPVVQRVIGIAAMLILIATAGYFIIRDQPAVQNVAIVPGKSGALLTLSDGSVINLDDGSNGVVANEPGATVNRTDSLLVYQADNNTASNASNTITVPRGRQFMLQLPDGTKVWLNAASSLTYPVAFNGKERAVKLTGEAYFEVAANSNQPFRVNALMTEVHVLGTSFNLNAYENEVFVNTTLIAGKILVNGKALNPGQQALVDGSGTSVRKAEIGKVMAWKNGLFNFEGATLPELMRQLERWYNIEVVYPDKIPDITFFGEINRNRSIEDVVNALRDANVNVKISGHKMIILP